MPLPFAFCLKANCFVPHQIEKRYIFFFLQEFDHYRLTGDQNSQRVMGRFANERNLGDIFERSQLIQLKTGLGILLPIFAYSACVNSNIWDKVGFSIAPHYKGGYIDFLSDFLRATKAVIRKRIASFKADT
jgi:hypothetical protein